MTGLSKQRRSIIWVTVTAAACLALAACHSSSVTGSGGITSASGPPTTDGSPTTQPTSGTPTPTTATTTKATAPATHTTTKKPSGGGTGPLTVDVNVVNTDTVSTIDCPHTFQIHAKITVNKGPTTIKYEWVRNDGTSVQNLTTTFSGPGTNEVIDSFQPAAIPTHNYTDTLVVLGTDYDASHNLATFGLTCAEHVINMSVGPDHGTCPYITNFSSTIKGYGPLHLEWHWHYSDGGDGGDQTKDVPAGPFSVDTTTKKFIPVATAISATVVVTSIPNYTSASSAKATCDA